MAMTSPEALDFREYVQFIPRPHRYRIGLVALSTDQMMEVDFARLIPHDEVGLYVSRVEFVNPVTPENLRRMEPEIAAAAAMILPGEDLDSLCYGCTSASATIGDDAVRQALETGKPGTPTTNPALAGMAAMQALGAQRISILTPYLPAASQPVADYFASRGATILSHHCLGLDHDGDIARLDHAALIRAAEAACHPDAEAVFLSCTALPAVSILPELEARLGRPVISSNQALAWMALRLAGSRAAPAAGGRLFSHDLTPAGKSRA